MVAPGICECPDGFEPFADNAGCILPKTEVRCSNLFCSWFPPNTTNATTRLCPPHCGQPGHCCPPGFEVDAVTGQCTLPKTECKNGLVNIAPGVCECPSGFKEYSSNDGAGCELPMSEVNGRPCRSQRHTRKF